MSDTRGTRTCAECGAASPDTHTNYTLISGQGWRVEVQVDDNGRKVAILRCPKCSARRRAKMNART